MDTEIQNFGDCELVFAFIKSPERDTWHVCVLVALKKWDKINKNKQNGNSHLRPTRPAAILHFQEARFAQ